jgi:hypothetical protein
VSAVLAQRVAALAAGALLLGVFGVAISQASRGHAPTGIPEPAVGPWGGWSTALAGVSAAVPREGRAGDCGWRIMPGTLGVLHPVLPCGARIFVEYGGRQALTRVVAQSPVADGRQLDLTPKLARQLRLGGVREVRWAYSR